MEQELSKSEKISLGTKEISRRIKDQLKKEFSGCVFSVTMQSYSMGSSISVRLMKSDRRIIRPTEEISEVAIMSLGTYYNREEIAKRQAEQYHQLNPVSLRRDFEINSWNNGVFLTEEGFKLLKRVVQIADQFNFNDSDSQTDYYSVNFSFDLQLGKYDKPFIDGVTA